MSRLVLLSVAAWVLVAPPGIRADVFDRYTNPVLRKAPGAEGVKEVKQLTPDLLTDNDQVIPNTTAALVIVKTNGDRLSKLLVVPAGQKAAGKASVPILLIERFVTYVEGEERTVQAEGKNIPLYNGFHFDLDLGQVVPADAGGDLKVVVDGRKVTAEPVGKAQLYLVTKPLPGTEAKKTSRFAVGEKFDPRFFDGTYKLHDDGRRSGMLILKVGDEGKVTGDFYSDKDGKKYEVKGKIGSPTHSIQFTVKFPRTEETFQGWMFTGDGAAIAGTSQMENRDAGFYAVRQNAE